MEIPILLSVLSVYPEFFGIRKRHKLRLCCVCQVAALYSGEVCELWVFLVVTCQRCNSARRVMCRRVPGGETRHRGVWCKHVRIPRLRDCLLPSVSDIRPYHSNKHHSHVSSSSSHCSSSSSSSSCLLYFLFSLYFHLHHSNKCHSLISINSGCSSSSSSSRSSSTSSSNSQGSSSCCNSSCLLYSVPDVRPQLHVIPTNIIFTSELLVVVVVVVGMLFHCQLIAIGWMAE